MLLTRIDAAAALSMSLSMQAFLPHWKLAQLPQQDNGWDCGLFVLTYADYFLHALPPTAISNVEAARAMQSGDPGVLPAQWCR